MKTVCSLFFICEGANAMIDLYVYINAKVNYIGTMSMVQV